MPKFQTAYEQDHKPKRYEEKCKGKTHQSFKDECNINNVMAKYAQTGQLPELIKKQPQYGDFSQAPDYQEAQNIVIRANAQFNSLDARVRERFANEPLKFLEFANNPANADEMAKLGLIKKEAVERVANAKKAASTPKTEPKNEAK